MEQPRADYAGLLISGHDMKIDCAQTIKTLGGPAYKFNEEELTLGDVIAECLANDKSGGKMKLFSLAARASKGGELEVDQADLALIKRAVDSGTSFGGNALILGQALELLEAVK